VTFWNDKNLQEYMSDAESLKQSMKKEKTFVSSMSSMFFGTKAAAAPVPSQRPVTDSFDYTAESRAKRANAPDTKVEKSESAVSNISRMLSGGTSSSSTNVPTTKPNASGAKGTAESKTTGAAKTVPKLSEYETQIMTGRL
jgi:hypothetical protein